MRTYVESLRRLYSQGRISENDIIERLRSSKITEAEYDYILAE